jgi:hypothetical protein
MGTRRGWHLYIFLLLAPITLLLTGCTTRAASPGRLFVSDETERLRQLEVAKAAAPLVQRGARVVVLIVQRGDNNGDDLTRRLTAINPQGYSSHDRIAPDAIAIYVSYEPRYAELRAGKNWSSALTNDALTDIRTRALNPALRSDDVTNGVTETLRRFESALMWRDINNLITIAIIVIIVVVVIWVIIRIVRSLLSGNIQWSSDSSDDSSDDPSDDWSYSSSSRSSSWDSSSDDSRSWGSSSSDSSDSDRDSSSSGGSW